MDEDDDLPSHFSMFGSPFQWRGSSPTVIDPLEELEKMMQDVFIGSGALFRVPNAPHDLHEFNAPPSQFSSPRDQLLKQQDSEMSPNPHADNNSEYLHSSQLDVPEQHRSLQPFNPGVREGQSLFSIFDRLMESFGRMDSFFRSSPFEGGEFSNNQSVTSPRDSMIKKDTDLDEQTESSGIDSLLLKEGPSYSSEDWPSWRPEAGGPSDQQWHLFPSQPRADHHVQRSFTSTSIRRIVRPDGSVEERRTYRDSSGKEEVTVTEMDLSTASPLLGRDDFFGAGGSSGSGSGSGSFLGSFFRNFF